MKYCVNCDFRTCEDETSCPQCGSPLNTVRRCKSCGADLTSEMSHCPRCRAALTPPQKIAKLLYKAHREQKLKIRGMDYEDEL